MPDLWESTTLRGVTLPNRLVAAPMCSHLAQPGVNEVTDRHITHYGALAMGGVGLVYVEATGVEYRGRIYVDDLGLWDDHFIRGHRRLTEFVHANTPTKICVQLSHAGAKANVRINDRGEHEQLGPEHPLGAEFVSSSAVPFDEDSVVIPRALTIDEMQSVKESFVQAAKRAVVAGYDMVEVHGAHGYLLNQFSSPETNKRHDEYGGSTLNRLRFPLEVVEAVREAIPVDMPMSVRMSATDWTDGGFSKADAIVYARELKKLGVSVINVSTGGVIGKQKVPMHVPLYQVPFATAIKEEVDIPVIAVGGLDDMPVACELVQTGRCDFVAIGRRLLRDPYWPRKARMEMDSSAQAWVPRHQLAAWYMSARKKAALEAKAKEEESPMPELDGPEMNVMCASGLCGWLSPRSK